MKRPVAPLALLLPLTTVVGAAVAGALVGIEVSLLVVAGGALVSVIVLLWASVQSLTGESPLTLEEALSLGAPSAEEEQKRAVLRALKDLEFERGVGKITQEDYVELSTRYRAEARRLMHQLDAGGEKDRAVIERVLEERLASAEPTKPKRERVETKDHEPDSEDAIPSSSEPKGSPKIAEGEGA
jgi:hypothetical protein